MVKKTYFQDVWLTYVRMLKLWMVKTKGKKISHCLICKADISLSNMGCSALDEHVCGQKHQKRDQSRNQSSLSSYFSKASITNSRPSNSASEQSECRITPSCSKTLDHMIISESTLNVKILWTLKVIQSHFSFRSCEELISYLQ